MSKRSKTLIEAIIVIAIVSFVVYEAIPYVDGPLPARARLDQMIAPVDYSNRDIVEILQEIVDAAPIPVEIRLCRELAGRRISFRTEKPIELKNILQEIASKVERDIVLVAGADVRPKFVCLGEDDFLTISKRQ